MKEQRPETELPELKKHRINWKKYLLELFSIFMAVSMAFALNKWNEDRKEDQSEIKILSEVSNGLNSDIEDLKLNILGHKLGIKAADYFSDLVNGKEVNQDSAVIFYFYLLRDFVSIQNKSGYESLKSMGLGLVKNDSLRLNIISVYDYHFEIIEKFEEDYNEMQFNQNYYSSINEMLSPYFVFKGNNLIRFDLPMNFSKTEKNLLLSYLWRLKYNRGFVLNYYNDVVNQAEKLRDELDSEIKLLN